MASTRSVILLAAAAPLLADPSRAQLTELDRRVQRVLEDARPALLAHLEAVEARGARAGEVALLVLAALHDGVDRSLPAMARATARLAAAEADQTYDLALRLLVLEADAAHQDRLRLARRDARQLLHHRSNGVFSYAEANRGFDLSNTQYAALGLRAAQSIGVRVERSVWSAMAETVGAQQHADGGFGYAMRDERQLPYASMTAAGIAVLAICRQQLDAGEGLGAAIGRRIDRGWEWFAKNATAIGSREERWSFYFHYGLERAAILCDVADVAGRSWYEAGANMLADAQLAGGGWQSRADAHPGGTLDAGRGDGVPTAFAVLFLRRKFAKVAGPVTPRVVVLANLGANAKDEDVAACAGELVRRGKDALPDVLAALRSEIAPQRRAAAEALRAIAGEDFGYDAAKAADGNRDALRKAELWFLRQRAPR